MDKKKPIGFAIVLVLLVGSLIVIGSGNTNESVNSDEEIIANENCLGSCGDCDGQCTGQGNGICDGSGTCSQKRQMNNNCNVDCEGTGLRAQYQHKVRSCISSSGCLDMCNN